MSGALDGLADRLESERDALVEAGALGIYSEIESYRAVPRAKLELSLASNIARGILTLRQGIAPPAAELDEAATATRERAAQGVPIEDIMRAYRISLRVIHDRFVELAREQGVAADEVLRGSNLLWMVGDWYTSRAATQYQARSIDEAVRRSAFVHDVVNGSGHLDNPLGLDEAVPLAVAVAQPLGDSERLERSLGAVVVGRVGDRVVGLIPPGTVPATSAAHIAVGPHVPFAHVRESAALAGRVLDRVRNFEPGVYTIADVSWRLAVDREPAVSEYVRDRYLAPLTPFGEFGELMVESLRAYLACDRSVRDAALALHVHQNTLRYRLSRFEEAVGASLDSTTTLVELAWALELDSLERATTNPD